MNIIEIDDFLSRKKIKSQGNILKILFKKRATIDGIIIREKDYEELKEKNFWRVIFLKDLISWESTRNVTLSRIFDGRDFRKLAYAER